MTKITRLTLAPDTCGVHNVTIDINSKNKSQKDRIRDLWLNDGIMERLDFKNDGARLHEGGSNGSSVRHVKQVIREVSVYIQRDKELQQASDAQFLVQCKPGSQRGRVSQADPTQDPESKEFLVTSMFGSSEENKNVEL